MNKNRRLAAILFADISGYTSMMEKDEKKAIEILDFYQKVLKEEVNKNQGGVVKNYGDGSICLFPTASGSVSCARHIQSKLIGKVPLRIGLHLGDVIYKDDDVYGDALNVASRIESMGVPGSVLLSQSLYEKVKNQPEFKFESLGRFEFKNIERGIEVYALANENIIIPKHNQLKGKFKEKNTKGNFAKWLFPILLVMILSIGFWLKKEKLNDEIDVTNYTNSIAVLPLKDLSVEQDNKFLGQGISAEIINLLSRVPQLKVIGRTSSFSFEDKNIDIREIADSLNVNYVLEGNIIRNNDKVKISMQLLNGDTGESLDSYQIDDNINNIFETQERIAIKTSNELKMSITENTLKSFSKPNIKAHLLFLQSEYIRIKSFPREMDQIENLLMESYSYDSTYVPVLYGLAAMPLRRHRYGKMTQEEAGNKMLHFLHKMKQVDSTSNYTIFSDALYHLDFELDYEEVFNKLNKINPGSNLDIIVMSGSGYYIGLNDIERGIVMVEKALERDPLYSWNYWNLGYLYYYNKEYEKSVEMLEKYSKMANLNSHVDLYSKISTLKKDYDKALVYADIEKEEGRKTYLRFLVYHGMGDSVKAEEMFQILENGHPIMEVEIAAAYALMDNPDKSFLWLEKAYINKNRELSSLKYNVFFDNLHSNPRWLSFLKKIGFSVLELR